MAGLDEEKTLRHVQSLAMATLIAEVLSRQFEASGDADVASRDLLHRYEQLAEAMTFDGVGAASSDYAAQEYRDTLIRIVLRARALATGERFDPDAYRKDWRKT